MIKYCECCGKKVEIAFGSTKFCNKCSKYLFELVKENNSLKLKLKVRDRIIGETKNGNI